MLTLFSPILIGFFKATKPKNGKGKGSKDKAASCVSAAYTKAMEHNLSSRPEYQQVICLILPAALLWQALSITPL